MHEEDLTDLAMIAACFQRLIARAADTAGVGVGSVIALSEAATAAMTGLSSVLGVSADQVNDRLDELRARVRTQPSGAVH